MSEGTGTKRLNAVVKELNVGIQTIVDHLAKSGHTIEAKPNTKITDHQYTILLDEFLSDKKLKEESKQIKHDRVKQKDITLDTLKPKQNAIADDDIEDDKILIKSELTNKISSPPLVAKKGIKVETIAEPIVIVSEKPENKTPKIQEENEEELTGLKVKGKIDLDAINTKTGPDKKSKDKKEKAEKTKPVKKSKVVVEETIAVEPQKIEIKVEPQATEEEQIKIRETKFEKLGGLKVLGKVELPVEPVKKPDESLSDKNKKKRKRTNFVGGSSSSNEKLNQFKGEKPKEFIPRGDKSFNRPPIGNTSNNRFAKRGPDPRGRDAKPAEKPEISEKVIQDKLKETLARLNPGSKNANLGSVRSKIRKQKRDAATVVREEALVQEEIDKKILKVTEFVTANELSKMMDISVTQIISACMSLGMMVSINQRLDAETITIVASEFGFEIEFVSAEVQEAVEEDIDEPENLLPRAPIVTVMGHVDHGKTSLLDYIRKANVIAGEAGGITQHVGAYEVKLDNGKRIAFLDTPGHEAFTAMRARGAKITDIVIVVVAADDSVMPQTKEAISHAQAAGVPIVFALNKMDRDGANPERIKEQLSAMNILVEDWGGKFQCQEISAKNGTNVEALLDKVLLEAEMLDLKANPNKRAVGSIIEATLDKGRGNVTTIMVQAGTLKVGDPIIAGIHNGRVKAMFDERGKKISEAGPSTPAVILGFDKAPQAGDKLIVTKTEQEAKEISNKRQQLQREQGIRTHKHITLDEIGRRLAIGNFKELKIIVKGDVDGSVEALSDSLIKLSTEEVQVSVIFKAVGPISESDVMLASASDAIIVGFQVRPSPQSRKLAEQEAIDIRLYSIIYNAIEEIKSAIEGMHAAKIEEKITGNAEIREVFKVTKVGSVAGCMVTDGKIFRNSKIRLIRDGVVVYTSELTSLKRFKDDAKEVVSGYDCGLTIHNFNDMKVGDLVEAYEEVEVKRVIGAVK